MISKADLSEGEENGSRANNVSWDMPMADSQKNIEN